MYLIKSASLLFNHYILPIAYMMIINLPGILSSALESDLAQYQQAGLAVRAIAADCNVGWVPRPERRNGPICIAASTSSESQQLLASCRLRFLLFLGTQTAAGDKTKVETVLFPTGLLCPRQQGSASQPQLSQSRGFTAVRNGNSPVVHSSPRSTHRHITGENRGRGLFDPISKDSVSHFRFG